MFNDSLIHICQSCLCWHDKNKSYIQIVFQKRNCQKQLHKICNPFKTCYLIFFKSVRMLLKFLELKDKSCVAERKQLIYCNPSKKHFQINESGSATVEWMHFTFDVVVCQCVFLNLFFLLLILTFFMIFKQYKKCVWLKSFKCWRTNVSK